MDQIYYADSSVLVKRHVREIGSGWFGRLVAADAGNTVVTSSLSIVEVLSALNRRCERPRSTRQIINSSQTISVLFEQRVPHRRFHGARHSRVQANS